MKAIAIAIAIDVGGSDDDLPALRARLTARPHLTLILGGVDSGFVHSLYVHAPAGNQIEL